MESMAAKELEIDEFGSEGIDSREGTYGGGGGRGGWGKTHGQLQAFVSNSTISYKSQHTAT